MCLMEFLVYRLPRLYVAGTGNKAKAFVHNQFDRFHLIHRSHQGISASASSPFIYILSFGAETARNPSMILKKKIVPCQS